MFKDEFASQNRKREEWEKEKGRAEGLRDRKGNREGREGDWREANWWGGKKRAREMSRSGNVTVDKIRLG